MVISNKKMGRHFLVLLLSLLVLAGIAAADGIDSYTTLMLHMDDTGLTDSSDSSHTITKNDNADRSAVQSKFGGYSVYFDGAGDYLSSQDSVDWDFGSGNFTVDAWVRLNSVSIDQGILGQLSSDNPAGNRWILSYNNDQNRIYFNVVEGGSNLMTLYSGWTPVADTWYHIAVVRAGSNDWHMYIDGVDQSLTGSANIVMPNLDNEFTVGRHITGSGALLYLYLFS